MNLSYMYIAMKDTKKRFIILPGNPPSEFFYSMWKQELSQIFPHSEFYYFDYPQLDQNCSSQYFENLTEAVYQKIKSLVGEEHFSILAHSVGGYFASHLLTRFSSQVEKCLLIFPFLGGPNLKGKAVLKFAALIEKNTRLKHQILSRKNSLTKFWPELEKIHEHELKSCTLLAYHEHNYLMQRQIPPISIDVAEKTHLIYNPKDNWCPPATIKFLKQKVKASYSPAKHDFVVSNIERKKINELVQNIFT